MAQAQQDDQMNYKTTSSKGNADVVEDYVSKKKSKHGQQLASEYARTREELVGYVSSLEGALERARSESQRFQDEALDARNHATLVAHHLTQAHRQARTLASDTAQALQAARHCKEQLRLTQALLAEEQIRSQKLESQIAELEKIANKKDELVQESKLKERRARRVLKRQNESLMRKATLSWILACLSNPYLEADTSKERMTSLMRMARDLLKLEGQSQKAAPGSLTYSDMKAKSLQLECAYVESEIKHLLQNSSPSSQTASEDHESAREFHSITPEILTARSHFSSERNEEGRPSSAIRGEQQKLGCSTDVLRSILKAAEVDLRDINFDGQHNIDGFTVDDHGDWDQLRSCNEHLRSDYDERRSPRGQHVDLHNFKDVVDDAHIAGCVLTSAGHFENQEPTMCSNVEKSRHFRQPAGGDAVGNAKDQQYKIKATRTHDIFKERSCAFRVPLLDLNAHSTNSAGFESPSSCSSPNYYMHMRCGSVQDKNRRRSWLRSGDDEEMRTISCMHDDEEYNHDIQQLPAAIRKTEKKTQHMIRKLDAGHKKFSSTPPAQRAAEREEITQCQTQIMRTLQGLKSNMGYLLDLEERSPMIMSEQQH